MRWLLLSLISGLLLCLVVFGFRPEAAPQEHQAEKVSSEPPPGVSARPDQKADFDPVAFLEECLAHYDRTVRGYRCIFNKQERINDRLQPAEEVAVAFREKPFSVYFQWLKGARKAERALYVAGENDGMMLVRPNGFIRRQIAGDIAERDPKGSDAMGASRYPITEFGLKKGTERTLASWKRARQRHTLHVRYLGVYKVKQLGDRECYKLERTGYDPPEEDGITELTVYIDKETLLQTGSVLHGEGGKLIAEYFFRDVRLNPKFSANQFRRSALVP